MKHVFGQPLIQAVLMFPPIKIKCYIGSIEEGSRRRMGKDGMHESIFHSKHTYVSKARTKANSS